ncbi:flavin reductase family protein [Pseudonocardia sp. WMMC193]|uniref:flavin reductase family protein n=1 Tax=Pseudonocardia sp. WMMC193 TaxID=2911965 RepID=UPI001F32ADC8|nr:flavin reductase family protein [Pseudonocardia sp. WMMC193]MCF7550835.1 flavin reductase family protein [Pseudonocardia sp. WMMC193]
MTGTAPIDPDRFRQALGHFASGVTVLTTTTADGPVGATVSAFCSLSLDPPLVLACVGRGRSMHRALRAARGFTVSILAADQGPLARAFARPGDRFAGVAHSPGRHGPVLDGAIAHLECARPEIRRGGDHVVVVAEVEALATGGGEPLLYAHGAFLDLPGPDWERATASAPQEWLLSAPW